MALSRVCETKLFCLALQQCNQGMSILNCFPEAGPLPNASGALANREMRGVIIEKEKGLKKRGPYTVCKDCKDCIGASLGLASTLQNMA